MNQVVAIHRNLTPDDPRSDAQITMAYGSSPDGPALAQKYPDFASDYTQLDAQRKEALAPSVAADFGAGLNRGTDSLLATGEGAVGLAAGAVHADSVKNFFLQKAAANEDAAAQSPPSVASVSDIGSASDAAHYAAGKLGELAPNIAQAGVTAAIGTAIGGAAGTAAEPGGGTVVGAGGGALYGFFESQAIKSLIKQGVADSVEGLAPEAIASAAKNLGQTYGTHIAETLNFWAQSAGSTYNSLEKNPDVDPGTAINTAIFGGLAQAIPAQYLPSTITKQFFGDAAVGPYFTRLYSNAAKLIPGGAAAMSMQELASIASEKYADPKTRDQAFDISSWTPADRSRLIESSVTGGLAGLVGAPIAAIPKGEPVADKTETGNPLNTYTGDMTPAREQQINGIAQRAATGELTPADEDAIKNFSPEQRNAFVLAQKDESSGGEMSGSTNLGDSAATALADHSDLAAVTARIQENPSPLVQHPELSDSELLQALQNPAAPSAAPQGASVPVMITRAMEAQLAARGLSQVQIDKLTPVQAHEILSQPPSAEAGVAQPEGGNPVLTGAPTVAPVAAPVTGNPVTPSPALSAVRAASTAALDPDAMETRQNVAAAAAKVEEKPPTPTTPTSAKPQVDIDGIKIAMENAQGGTRTGKSGDWQVEMPAHYGEIVGSKGADGDPIDAYIGSKPESDHVFVIDQHNPDTGEFDEHKVMMGFDSQREAEAAYDAAFSDGKGPARRGNITETTKDGLKQWLDKGDHTQPFADTGGPKVSEKVVGRAGKVGIENIDLDNSNLASQESKKGQRGGAAIKFEPSYFEVKPADLADEKTLGDRLVSGSRSNEGGRSKTDSRRLTAFHDNQTGKVFLLGTYRDGDGSVKVADPAKVGERAANTRLGDFIGQKTDEGEQRYTPIASMRLNEVKRSFVQEYPDRAAFDKDIGHEASQSMFTMSDHAQTVEEMHQAGLKERGINLPGDTVTEHPETGEELEAPSGEASTGESKLEDAGFTPAHANALWNVFGGDEDGEFDRNRFDELASTNLKDSRTGIAAVKAAFNAVKEDHPDMDVREAMEATLGKIYDTLEAGYNEGKEAFKESAARSFGGRDAGGDPEAAAHAEAAEATAGQRVPEQQSQDQEGDQVPDSGPVGDNPFRKPQGTTSADPAHEVLFNATHDAAVKAGLNVKLIAQDLTGMSGDFSKRTGAAYDRASRTVLQVVASVIGKEDFTTILHEVGHDVFTRLPTTVRSTLLSAIDRMSDIALGTDQSPDPRIRSDNPSDVANIHEERLVEATALKLAQEGFSAKAARGYAQSFVRALKDLYLRAAMSIQRALFGKDFTDPRLVQAFFENRVKDFLAGSSERTSFIDMLGGGKAPESHVASWHASDSPVFERLGAGGIPEYGHVPDTSLEASRLNNLVFRKPDNDQKTDSEIRIALQNNTIQHMEDAAKVSAIEARLAKTGKTASAYFSKLLGITNPEVLKRDILMTLQKSKPGVTFDEAKTVDGFKSSAGDGRANLSAYRNNQAIISKMGDVAIREKKAVTDATNRLTKIRAGSTLEIEGAKNEIASLNNRVALAKRRMEALGALEPVIKADHANLASKIGAGAGFTFADKATYFTPSNPDAKPDALLAERKDGEDPAGWKKQTLKLDTSRNEVTEPAIVEAHIRSLNDWLKNQESKFDAGDETAKGSVYQSQLNVFNELAANKNFSLRVSPSDRTSWGLSMLGPVQQLESVNTPSTRSLGARVRVEQSEIDRMRPTVDRGAVKTEMLENQLIKLLPEKMMDKRDTLRRDFLNPIKRQMQAQLDAGEKFAGDQKGLRAFLFNRAMDTLKTSDATNDYIKGNEAAWRTGIENLIDHHIAFSDYFNEQARGEGQLSRTVAGRQVPTGQNVLDPKLKVNNPVTGKLESAIRKPVAVGPVTFPQQLSDVMRSMANALRNSGWAVTDKNKDTPTLARLEFGKIAALLKNGKEADAKSIVSRYTNNAEFGDSIQHNFIQEIMQETTGSLIDSPKHQDEIDAFAADPEKVNLAYEQHGNDLIDLLKAVHQSHGGDGDVNDYVQGQLLKLAEVAQQAHEIVKKTEPVGSDRVVGIRGMFSDFALNSREIEGLPGKWFDFHDFDDRDTSNMMKRIAAQKAYGRGGEAGALDLETAQNEIAAARDKLERAQDKVRRENPTASPKDFKIKVIAEVKGQQNYDLMNKLSKNGDFVRKAADQIISSHRYNNSPTDALSFVTKAVHSISSAMINQPSSALMLLTQNTDAAIQYGGSSDVVKEIARGYGRMGKDVARSLLASIGYQMDDNSELADRFKQGNYNEPSGMRLNREAFQNYDDDGLGAHFLGSVNKVLSAPLDRVGEKGSHVPFQPGKIFDYAGVIADRNSVAQVWNLAQLHLARAVDFYKDPLNLDKLNDPDYKINADDLGLKGSKKDGYNKFTGDMLNYGMSIDDVARNAIQRDDSTLLTNFEADKLRSMALHEIALQGGISNSNAAWRTNPILKLAAPLLQWSLRRSQQIASLPLNAEGKIEMQRTMRALAGVGIAATGGLAVSALIDQYYQKALGKERNIVPFSGTDGTSYGLGLMENLSRVGTFGMFGELANTVAGIGQGGDNREVSLDERVLAASSLLSILRAADSFVNQGGKADYTHVIRPLLGSMGGGGLIQYMQLANNTLGLDNVEARVTARINAQNYLRVVGRQLGMDVRVSDGGTYTPTPVSPYLTNMELAAYKNSGGDFRKAYQDAIQAAKEQGHDDPVDYVKRAFATRNPLRSVFTTPPSASDYTRLLSNMPGSGMQDVSQAVKLFNEYAESIGAKGFDGKPEKSEVKLAHFSMGDLRQKSALALQ